jgi:hypothetical protein
LSLGFGDRPLQREDLWRVDLYTSKVRHLVLASDKRTGVLRVPLAFTKYKKRDTVKRSKKSWKALWEEIASVRPPSQTFCNLQSIHISNVTEQLLIPLIGISGSHLAKLYINHVQLIETESVVRRILDGLKHTPHLEYLFVRDGEFGFIPENLLIQAPLKYVRLDRHFEPMEKEIGPQEAQVFYHVLQKSTIKDLTIGLDRNWCCTHEMQTLRGRHLPALKTLCLNLEPFQARFGCTSCRPSSWVCDCPGLVQRYGTSPVVFFSKLDGPELTLLNIKFPAVLNGAMILDLVSEANRSCRLRNLTELSLTQDYGKSNVIPAEMRTVIQTLLPLPSLKTLRLDVGAHILDVLDLRLYKSIAEGLPALETLWLGHSALIGQPLPLAHLAAFCQMLPSLVQVVVGGAESDPQGTPPRREFVCLGVRSAKIMHVPSRWRRRTDNLRREELLLGVQVYFPNSDQAKYV